MMTVKESNFSATRNRLSRHWRNEAARLIAVEIELVLRRQNVPVVREILDIAGRLAGEVLIALTSLPSEHRLALDCAGELFPDAISRLVLSLAVEFNERQRRGQPLSGNAIADQADVEISAEQHQGRLTLMQSWAGEVAGQTFIEDKLSIPRSTLHLWKRRNEVIALPKSRRTHVFPLAQFVDGRPVDGISQVLAKMQNPRSAWLWLIHPCALLDGKVPLDLLKQNRAAQVENAAAICSETV
ncbi:hypothetical protein [Mesorhizobium sp. B4-1-4]|uniref:antitoxin Xre/MbcA/ParS-like domain-containing protein n=1 Tax=Mesorhizobium sp. B4-1-4 TaxID=2589888 RepID=UPI0015E2705E|nr:hypothetical protein [Mesorhizobium sp. B4-1-4]UCI32066.1 hypothetical protein FJW03_00955 [Mesorhizobium sp. B4-1-4]